MQYFVNISIFILFYIGSLHQLESRANLTTGYRRKIPSRSANWEPTESVTPPPLEDVTYSVVTVSLDQGDALYWDTTENVLFFSDVTEQTLYRYNPTTKELKSIELVAQVSLVIPIKGQKHHLVVSQGSQLVVLKWLWDSGNISTTHLASVNTATIRNHWTSGRADGIGRIWAESVNLGDRRLDIQGSANLYVIDTVKSCRIDSKYSDQDVSSGLAWSPDNKVLYYTSPSRKIQAFNYNIETGTLGSPRTVFDYGDLPGSPAGLAVNQDGDLWIASYGGSQMIKINPDSGRILRRVKLPVQQVTSIVFGGPTLEDLYVASAQNDTDDTGLQGAVIKIIDLKETGVPMYPADIICEPCNDKMGVSDASSWLCTASNDF